MKHLLIRSVLPITFLLSFSSGADAREITDYDAWSQAYASQNRTKNAKLPVYATSFSPSGQPSILVLPRNNPPSKVRTDLGAARSQLHALREHYGVSPAVVHGTRHRFTHDNGRGPIIVILRQTVGDIDVFHGDVKVMLDRSRRVRAISGSMYPAAHAKSAQTFDLSPDEVISLALRDLLPQTAPPATPLRTLGHAEGGWERFELLGSPGFVFRRPARLKQVYFPEGDAVIPAYHIELQTLQIDGKPAVIEYVLAATDGRVLVRRDLTAYESFQYRVWADEDEPNRPADSPLEDFSPYPGDVPGEPPSEYTTPSLITMEGFNMHSDPWLPDGAIESSGNNVDAYIDHSNPDGLSDGEYRASVTSPGVFDHTYDVTQEPLANQTQSMAATVQMFYTINWLHDWWYDSGFDEQAGNAQVDNYGRGGVEGDVLHAHAQDGALEGERNNANMSTPADGESPRMQMYLTTTSTGSLSVTPLNEDYNVSFAQFGPKNFDFTGSIVVIDDGEGESSDGCQPAVNNLAGQIALIDRGGCSFEVKTGHAEDANAIGVLLANNQPGDVLPGLGKDVNHPDPTIPILGVSNNAGIAIKAGLNNNPQIAHMVRETPTERDGSIDNLVITHELGHYFHDRMVELGTRQTGAQGEGWGDFISLQMSLREGDDLDGAFGHPYYSSNWADDTGYFGYRRVTYSADFDKNALTFRHISNGEVLPDTTPIDPNTQPNSEVHNAGEIWATMLWHSYIALHKEHDGQVEFEEVQRRMTDYVVAGMLMAPSLPTFTEQRDAILLAIAASETPEDFEVVASAFAERGAGTCAESPERASTDLVGVVEDFTLNARAQLTGASLTDTNSCDDDGIVDVGELGHLSVGILNTGTEPITAGSTLEVLNPDPALVFPDGASVTIPEIGPGMNTQIDIPVTIDEDQDTYQAIVLDLRLTTPNGCETVLETQLRGTIHGDILVNGSKSDDVETPDSPWEIGGLNGEESWAIVYADGYRWHGDNLGSISDTWLETPTLEVRADEPLVVTFDHAYAFELSDDINWDGAVIEISGDNGETWEDVSQYTDPGYTGVVDSEDNPLHERPVFGGESPSYPELEQLTLDFGMNFAEAQTKIRFRIGSDSAVGAPGWDLDNFVFSGIENTPFSIWVTEDDECVQETDTDTVSVLAPIPL